MSDWYSIGDLEMRLEFMDWVMFYIDEEFHQLFRIRRTH